MIPFDEALTATLRRLGVGDPDVMFRIRTEWPELAGAPWDSQSRPSHIAGGVLYVEAVVPAAVRFLRYGTEELKNRLCHQLGDVVERVEVTPPGSR